MDWVGLIKELAIVGLVLFIIYMIFQCIKHFNELTHRAKLQRERQSHEEQILSIRQEHEKELLFRHQQHEVIMYLIKINTPDYIFKKIDELNKLLSHYDIHDGKDKNKGSDKPDNTQSMRAIRNVKT